MSYAVIYLQGKSLCASNSSFLSCIRYIKAYDATQAFGFQNLATQVYGFASTDDVGVILLVFSVVMMGLQLVTFIQFYIREWRSELIHVEKTNRPPSLVLQGEERFHLFNSRKFTRQIC